ncbi:Crp/Fnr family transcriptional regulator [Methylorubrum extorquens]|nr:MULTISPECIES: Crp/Fnr family transcriptional regulator [Methylorubrum]MCP1535469.1 CRP-like cAMP-binding protein [Methylorubrum extorquens]
MLTHLGAGDRGFENSRPALDGIMSPPFTSTYANRLLQAFALAGLASLEPHLKLVTLALGEVLIRADTPIAYVHFVERGIVSLVAVARDGEQIETGLVGCEGMVGIPVLLGAESTPNEARVQAAGLAYAMHVEAFRDVLRCSPVLHEHLLRYAQVLNTQVACTALANGRYKVGQRLARWLLMCHDRTEGDTLPTTHRFLSLMLGVNRPGLTTAVAALERAGIIATRRGTITICDRDALLVEAGAAYGVPEAEYERLIEGTVKPAQ